MGGAFEARRRRRPLTTPQLHVSTHPLVREKVTRLRDERTLRPIEYYNKLPSEATVAVCLVLDPMLATGGSAVATIDILKKWGAKRVKYVGLIAAPEGVRALSSAHPDVPIHVAALDERLNEKGYIVPGLGDAGDRQFGTR